MKWSPQQDDALLAFKRWWEEGCPGSVFHIFGFAGSGKTTLAKELASFVGGKVNYAAFTGKAASVMRSKGCFGASTIHSLIYNTKRQSRLRLLQLERQLAEVKEQNHQEEIQLEIQKERVNLSRPDFTLNINSEIRYAKLIIIDEVSMVDGKLGQDLLSFNKPILVLGDPAQLTPVKGTGFFMTEKPEIMLTEVHRTALDNPVLFLATQIRSGDAIALGDYGESRVVTRSQLELGSSLQYDQIIVGRNATRMAANDSIRSQLKMLDQYPMVGDKLVCLRNNHQLGLMNGALFRVKNCVVSEDDIMMSVEPEDGGEAIDVVAYPHPFRGQEVPRWGSEKLEEFTYGYAITCHKAQGSEWPSVFIVDESSAFRADRNRWLYTALTRASKKVIVVR